MADVFDAAKRSQVMSRIRSRGNKTTEEAMRRALRDARITGWRRHVELRPLQHPAGRLKANSRRRIKVRPDFLFREARLAVFVDGCFWHQCPLHSNKPTSNSEYWTTKLQRNVARDRRATRALKAAGWAVLRVWEHELIDEARVTRKVLRNLQASGHAKNIPLVRGRS
jgi:DNA mismatch endonuclease, patch repair protein